MSKMLKVSVATHSAVKTLAVKNGKTIEAMMVELLQSYKDKK